LHMIFPGRHLTSALSAQAGAGKSGEGGDGVGE
jgi:hypothetical protein